MIVVGAGVIGLSIAWHLLGAGAAVTVVESTGVAAGASGVQPGGVRQQWSTRVSCQLARESAGFYGDFSDRLEARAQPVLERCGYLFVADTEDALRGLADNVSLQNELGIPSRILSPADAAEVVPGLRADGMAGASFCGEDGYFDKPQAVVEAFAAAVARLGGELAIGTADLFAPIPGGWRTTLVDGRWFDSLQVVVAAGVDTPPLLERLGVTVPIVAETRYLFLSEPIRERLLEPLVVAPERRFAAKQLAGGRVLTSDLGADGDPEPDAPHGFERWPQESARCSRSSNTSPSRSSPTGSTTSPRIISRSSIRSRRTTVSGLPPASAVTGSWLRPLWDDWCRVQSSATAIRCWSTFPWLASSKASLSARLRLSELSR